jgi:dTDP-L-rhamnose 4-epimerase
VHVLVTGGAGFIGSHVVEALLAAGHEVRVLDVLLPAAHPGHAGNGGRPVMPVLDGRAELVVGNLRDPAMTAAACRGVDVVCHQAAMVGLGTSLDDAPDYAANNDLGTAVLLAAMASAGVGRLVLASSMVVYGEGAYQCPRHGPVRAAPRLASQLEAGVFDPPCPSCARPLSPRLVTEDAPADPRNVYAATKLAQEHLTSAWARATGGRASALRYHNVYGPRMPRDTPYAGVASLFRSSLAAGRAPEVFEDGGQRRDFVHVTDVARANVLAVEQPGPTGSLDVYNIGSGEPHTIGDMAAALAAAYGGPPPYVCGRYRLGDVRHVTASSARARRLLGYRPAVGFAAGMAAFAHAPLRGGAAAPTPRVSPVPFVPAARRIPQVPRAPRLAAVPPPRPAVPGVPAPVQTGTDAG